LSNSDDEFKLLWHTYLKTDMQSTTAEIWFPDSSEHMHWLSING